MELIKTIIVSETFNLADLGSGKWINFQTLWTDAEEHPPTAASVEVSWTGMTGGATNNNVCARAIGLNRNHGFTLPTAAADAANQTNPYFGHTTGGASTATGRNRDLGLWFGNTGLTGFAAAGSAMAFFSQDIDGLPLLPVLNLYVILTGGSAYSGGTCTVERLRLYRHD